MTTVRFVDTTLRDGQQSLWALRMTTSMMLPAASDIDAAGFDSAEFLVPANQFARTLRDLKEDPWDWVRLGAPRFQRTRLRMIGAFRSYFGRVPTEIQRMLFQRLSDHGVSITRTSDPWNDFTGMETSIQGMAEHGIDTVLNIIYSVSPRHTLEYYANRTRDAAKLNPFRICFKDVGGLLTPDVAMELLPIIVKNAGGIPVEFHAHCNNSLAPYNVILAVAAGITIIHTAIPPLANGASQPSVFSTERNLRERGYTTELDTQPLARVRDHFFHVAAREGLPTGEPTEYDESIYRHQVPGGMISNLVFHLDQSGLAGRLEEVLEEAARVRADLGFPIMVTPLSQFVGSQAAINVSTGKRYSVVADDVIRYALGRYGQEATVAMDPEVRALILDRPRTAEIEEAELGSATEPSLEDLRAKFGGCLTDEELIVRLYAGVGSGELGLRKTIPPSTYEEYKRSQVRVPLARLLGEFTGGGLSRLDYKTPDGSLTLMRSAKSPRNS